MRVWSRCRSADLFLKRLSFDPVVVSTVEVRRVDISAV